ncbi:CrcB family protein [Microbacteriaceae bacterium VKM Ac-2854]|nr:CrcB family protein [Microbacteriaceae bacterium VKM Ac-2854]
MREGLSLLVPVSGAFPAVIFGINVVGAFLLGVLLEALLRRGADGGRRRVLRLLLGTGVLGGFTTYSALATDTALLLGDGQLGPAILYGGLTIVVGAAASWAGIAVAARRAGAAS